MPTQLLLLALRPRVASKPTVQVTSNAPEVVAVPAAVQAPPEVAPVPAAVDSPVEVVAVPAANRARQHDFHQQMLVLHLLMQRTRSNSKTMMRRTCWIHSILQILTLDV